MTDTLSSDIAAADTADLEQRLIEASKTGMTPAVWAQIKPDAVSVYDTHGTRTFGALNANANRVVRLLRDHGLQPGDPVALLCSNRAEFLEVLTRDPARRLSHHPGQLAPDRRRDRLYRQRLRGQGAVRRDPL